jgi:hypothetical protein
MRAAAPAHARAKVPPAANGCFAAWYRRKFPLRRAHFFKTGRGLRPEATGPASCASCRLPSGWGPQHQVGARHLHAAINWRQRRRRGGAQEPHWRISRLCWERRRRRTLMAASPLGGRVLSRRRGRQPCRPLPLTAPPHAAQATTNCPMGVSRGGGGMPFRVSFCPSIAGTQQASGCVARQQRGHVQRALPVRRARRGTTGGGSRRRRHCTGDVMRPHAPRRGVTGDHEGCRLEVAGQPPRWRWRQLWGQRCRTRSEGVRALGDEQRAGSSGAGGAAARRRGVNTELIEDANELRGREYIGRRQVYVEQ